MKEQIKLRGLPHVAMLLAFAEALAAVSPDGSGRAEPTQT